MKIIYGPNFSFLKASTKPKGQYSYFCLMRRNANSWFILLFRLCIVLIPATVFAGKDTTLVLKKTIRGGLTPKSIVHNGNGLFFAQNMMYSHTISVFDENYRLVKTISDRIQPEHFGIKDREGTFRGAPVECAFTPDGKYAYVSNYCMQGDGFEHPGCDTCYGKEYDISYIYKINTESLEIENIIPAGSVPKYLAISPDGKKMLVSNWSSGDVTLFDLSTEKELKRFHVGRFPRGIAIDSKSRYAYVTVMGGTSIQRIDLEELSSSKFMEVGKGPRHLCIDSRDSLLYVSVNNEGNIARINLHTGTMQKLFVGSAPRSMVLGKGDRFLYVVNYSASTFSKIDLEQFSVAEKAVTGKNPIGITFNERTNEIWVACYSGSVMVYKDLALPKGNLPLADYFGMQPVFDDLYEGWNLLFSKKEIASHPIQGSSGKTPASSKEGKGVNQNEHFTEKTIANALPNEKSSDATPTETGTFYVVTGSFKNSENAGRKTKELVQSGFKGKMVDSGKGLQYAAIGGFVSKDKAQTELDRYKSQTGLDAWVWEKK